MLNLIPEIEIGKKYLWRPQPTELVCPNCNEPFWSEIQSNSREILIMFKTNQSGLSVYCDVCSALLDMTLDGWYSGTIGGGRLLYVVPSTQLEEIKEEDEDEDQEEDDDEDDDDEDEDQGEDE